MPRRPVKLVKRQVMCLHCGQRREEEVTMRWSRKHPEGDLVMTCMPCQCRIDGERHRARDEKDECRSLLSLPLVEGMGSPGG